MKGAYTRIKKPRRVTDDPVIYVCSPYAKQTPNATPAAQRTSAATSGKWAASRWPRTCCSRAFMNENRHKEREAGLRMAPKLLAMCDEMWVFGDEISEGMVGEIIEASARASRSITTTAPSP